MSRQQLPLPLQGVRVIEISSSVAAAYAGRMLTTLGASTCLIECPGGSPMRREPPFLSDREDMGASFAFLSAGKKSIVVDLEKRDGKERIFECLENADILIEDLPVDKKSSLNLQPEQTSAQFPDLVHVSVLPFGSTGPKASWKGEEINLIHASGEGFLLPNGLTVELFPERPPLKIHGYFAEMQGGAVGAFSALMGLWARPLKGGQYVDVSVQDANVATGAFAVQRLGDGSLEHRTQRSFKYGGVLPCADGYIEILTLEDRQWEALVQLIGHPEWATDERFKDPIERSLQGEKINKHLREWALNHSADEVAHEAQSLGIPVAKYRTPSEILAGEHERSRGLFGRTLVPGVGPLDMFIAPYHFNGKPLKAPNLVPDVPEYDPQKPIKPLEEEV